MSVFSLEEFRAVVLQYGLAKSHRFEVMILAPAGLDMEEARYVSLFADGTQLPQTRINTTQMRMWGSPRQMPQWAEYGGDNITINFHLDRKYDIKRFFDMWVDKIVDRDTSTVGYYSDYISDIIISQLDENEDVSYTVTLKEAYPISVNPIQLDMNSPGLSRLSVTFTYKKWFEFGATGTPAGANAPPPNIDPTKPKPKPDDLNKKVDYTGQSSVLGGTMKDPMSFDVNSGFGA